MTRIGWIDSEGMSSHLVWNPICVTLVAIAIINVIQVCAKDVKYGHSLQELELTEQITIDREKCRNDSIQVFVHSAATTSGKYFERRKATRETWAQRALFYNFSVIFVLGQPRNQTNQIQIIKESDRFGDILQFAFIDDYHNLTLKALALLRWISINCMSGQYIVKTDDDILVNSERLRRNIDSKVFLSGITGKLFTNSKPVRDLNDQNGQKWFVPKHIYDKEYYPSYLSGAAYVMSTDVIPKLYRSAIDYSGPVLYIDDLYLTGIITNAYNINIHNSPEFFLSSSESDFCGINVCTMHTISIFHGCNSVDQFRHLWNLFITTSLNFCKEVLSNSNTASTKTSLIVPMIIFILIGLTIFTLIIIWQFIKPSQRVIF